MQAHEPNDLDIFERLGVLEQVRDIGVHKPGAAFASDRTGRHSAFPFANALNRDRTHAWQVKRAALDALLFANTVKHGATAIQETRVTDVQRDEANRPWIVTARDKAGETLAWRARYLLDASGRDTFMASRLNVKDSNKYNKTSAVYEHFAGVACHEGELLDEGRHRQHAGRESRPQCALGAADPVLQGGFPSHVDPPPPRRRRRTAGDAARGIARLSYFRSMTSIL
jgi:2-polyprenyl-6-methoxyphenol hydroxylase-like FAD-dependent oxidoreductase